MTLSAAIFYVFAAILVFAALRVITVKNPVHAALFLVLSFFSASAIWMLLKAEFLAIALVLVYVGAVMVLFLFVVMMLDINIEKLREGFKSALPVGILVGVLVLIEMVMLLMSAYAKTAAPKAVDMIAPGGNTKALGRVLYSEYLLAFELAAVVLLVAIIAAIALTLRVRRDSKYQSPGEQVKVRREDRVRVLKVAPSKPAEPPAPPAPPPAIEAAPAPAPATATPAAPAAVATKF